MISLHCNILAETSSDHPCKVKYAIEAKVLRNFQYEFNDKNKNVKSRNNADF